MKNLAYIILSAIFLLINAQSEAANDKVRVFISQIVTHPALEATIKGICDELKEQGYTEDNLELKVESAQGSTTLAGQIATKFVNQNPDIVIGVGTLAAQSFSKYARKGSIKLVFSSVTDPQGSKLVKSITTPGNNTSGVSNFLPLDTQLELFKKIQPGIKRLGFLYNPSELNSISMIKTLEKLCPKFGLVLVTRVASKSADVSQSATALSKECDAIFISNDNTALSAMPAIVKAAVLAQIPVYVSDTDAVEMGAVAALGPNQYNIGRQTGKMAISILKGEDINLKPVEFPSEVNLYINSDAALKAGITIPDEIMAKATKIISDRNKF